LSFLLGLFDNESCSFGILLGDLLLFDCLGELAAKGHVGDGDVFERDVEFSGSAHQIGADALGDGFSLGDEFCGVELGDDGFEDFVADGGEDSFIVILTQ
jgi:hypothetical protein